MASQANNELVKIGPGLGRRSKIWSVVKKRVHAKLKSGALYMKEKEKRQLDRLAEEALWFNMVPLEFQTMYGTQYDESESRAPISSKTKDQIIRDVPRTFTLYIEHQRYLRLEFPADISSYFKALQHVLEVACHQDFGCGYCQGMNFLAATFLLSEANQRSAFILFSYLVKQCHLELLYNPKCSSLLEYMQYYDRRLAAHNRSVHAHLEAEEFPPLCYSVEWFTTCFLVSSPGELSACVIDLMLCGFSDIMVRVGLALMDHLQSVVLHSNAEKLQLNFKKMLVLANCVEVMSRALMIPCDELNGTSRLEAMKLNTDTMDPDEEWVDTMRSPTFRIYPGDPLPEDLQGLFPADGVPAAGLLDPLGESGTTEESAFAPSSTQSSRDKPRHLTSSSSFSRAPVELQHSVSAPNLPSGASPCARAVNEPSGGTMSADFSISNDHSRSYNNYNNNSSGVMYSTGYDAPTPRAVSPALPTTPGVSEGSNGHHCITCAGALDGHMLEDYVCQLDQRPHLHLRGDEESSCTDSPVPAMQPSPTANVTNVTNNSSMTSSQRSRSGRIPLSPTKESSLKKEGKSTPTSGDKDRDKKAKKAQFVSSEAAAAKEIMTLFMG